MKRVQSLLGIAAVVSALLIGGVAVAVSQAQTRDCRFFDETGHWVCGDFLEFYDERGGLEIFGYPLTEAEEDLARGLRVQYFQRARMELHSYNPGRYRVQLGLLVDELGYLYPSATPEEIPALSDPNHQYFPQTGHVVSYAFLRYFREKGGVDIFGYPRSEILYEDGYYVQYFQRARMEWRPENAVGSQVRLTDIGEIYARVNDINTAPAIIELRRLNVTASVRHIIVSQQGTQAVFVYVVDQYQNPVEGVDLEAVVRYQDGGLIEQACELDRTTASGFAKCSFDLAPSQSGQKVIVDVTARRDSLVDATQTFFFLWW